MMTESDNMVDEGPKKKTGRKILFLLVVIGLAVFGIAGRLSSARGLSSFTEDQSIPTVGIIKPSKSNATEELVLPGTVQAWHEAPIYARTSGYLKTWNADIGTKVKAGEVLATIETPEVDSELRQAEADLKLAEANNTLAQSTATRWENLLKSDSVSKQEAAEKMGDAAAKAAAVASAKANVQRLRDLESFKRVVAPFGGVITARNTDIGALINAGSSTSPELFHVADISKLRIYVQVPQNYAGAITPDITAELHFAEHPGKVFDATLNKTASAFDPTARTLLVQFELDNKDGEIFSGGFTEAHLKLPTRVETLRLPVNTLLYRGKTMQVGIIENEKDGAGTAKLQPITLGRDYGTEVEVITGITLDDTVIVNPPDSLSNGQKVKVTKIEEKKKDSAAKVTEKK